VAVPFLLTVKSPAPVSGINEYILLTFPAFAGVYNIGFKGRILLISFWKSLGFGIIKKPPSLFILAIYSSYSFIAN